MKNLKGKGLLTILLVLALFVSSASMVFADLQSFLVQAEDGRYYEYNSGELNNSYLQFQMDPTNPAADMYEQFLAIGGSTRVVALGDSVKGWMDFAAAQNASLAAQIAGVPFVINDFFATPAAPVYAGTVTDPIVVKPDGTTADLEAYNAALADVATKVEADYTADSWANLQTVLAANVMTAADTQARIDEAAGAINGAIEALVEVPAVDLAAYDTALAAANAKVEADYTADSWTNLQTVKAANVMTVANTQVEIDAAVAAINTAVAGLVFADQADLDAAKTAAAAKVEADYTADSFAALTAALALPEATNAEVVAKTTAITAAIGALVEVADMAAYDAAVAQAEAVVEADYTAATYAALQTALTDNVVTNQDSQADVDAATAAINGAYAALVEAFKVASVKAINTTSTDDVSSKVESGATLVVEFNQAIDSTTATGDYFVLKTGTTTVAENVTLSADKKSVSIKPVTPLTVGTAYSLAISADVKAVDGTKLGTAVTKTFTVADALSIASIKNASGTVVDTYETSGSALTITFNKDLSATTVNTDTVKLYNETDKVYVTVTLGTPTTKTVSVTPGAGYTVGKQYSLKINGVKSLDDKAISGYVKTYGYNSVATPTVTVTAAAAAFTNQYNGIDSKNIAYTGTAGGAPSATMQLVSPIKAQIQFGRAMDATTVTSDNFYIAEADAAGNEVAGTKVAGAVSYDAASYVATFTPAAALKENQKYVAVVNTSVKDATGIPVTKDTEAFKTDDFTAPTVTSTSVDTGARVDYNQDIVIHFSEKMQSGQIAAVAPTAVGGGEGPFTTTTSVRLYNQTTNTTIAATFDKSYVADATDPRLVIKAPTGGWALNSVYQVVLNGYTAGETNMCLTDVINATTKKHGNMLAGDLTTTFTTIEKSLPSVTSAKVMKTSDGVAATNPTTELSLTDMTYNVQNAGTADVNNVMKVTFNKNMLKANLTATDFVLWYDDGGTTDTADDGIFGSTEKYTIGTAELTVSSDKKTVTWTPSVANLATLKGGEHEGRLVINNTIKDESGQAMGTTTDATRAYLLTTGIGPVYATPTDTTSSIIPPVKFATGVLTTQILEVKFNEAVKYTTLNNVQIRKGAVDGELVSGVWYSDVAGTTYPTANLATAFFKPDTALAANTKYFVVVPATVTDARGNAASAYNYYFTTQNTVSPTATFTMPANYADPIKVNFDQAMNATDIAAEGSYTVVKNGTSLATFKVASVDTAKKVATIYLDAAPSDGDVIQVTVNAGVRGANGVAIPSNITSSETNISNPNAITTYGIKTATYNTTNKILTITLDRPANTIAVPAFNDIVITAGAYTTDNFVSLTQSSDGLTATYVLKNKDAVGGADVQIAPGVTKVALASTYKFANSAGAASGTFNSTAVTIN